MRREGCAGGAGGRGGGRGRGGNVTAAPRRKYRVRGQGGEEFRSDNAEASETTAYCIGPTKLTQTLIPRPRTPPGAIWREFNTMRKHPKISLQYGGFSNERVIYPTILCLFSMFSRFASPELSWPCAGALAGFGGVS